MTTTPPRPSDFRVELAIGAAGAWVDITASVEIGDAAFTWSAGLTDRFGDVAPSQWAFTLRNGDGAFTPDNPVSPYYGLLIERVPVRVSIAGYAGPQAFGFKQWTQLLGEVHAIAPGFPGGESAWSLVVVSCVDVLARLSRGTLRDLVTEQTMVDGAAGFWLCDDPVGSSAAAESSPSAQAPLAVMGEPRQIGWGGGIGTNYDGARSIRLNSQADLTPGWLAGSLTGTAGLPTFELWFTLAPAQIPAASTHAFLFSYWGPTAGMVLYVDSSGYLRMNGDTTHAVQVADGRLHHVVIQSEALSGVQAYVDGVSVFYWGGAAPSLAYPQPFLVGPDYDPQGSWAPGITIEAWPGTVGRIAGYWNADITAIAAHYQLATTMQETAPARIARLMSFAGGTAIYLGADSPSPGSTPVPTALAAIDSASGALIGPQTTSGMTLLAAIQEAWRSEGGQMWTHRTFYINPAFYADIAASQIVFAGRASLRPISSTLTLDVEADLDAPPTMDRTAIGQVSTVAATSKTLSNLVQDAALAAAIGNVSATVNSALVDLGELGFMASDRIARTRNVRLRVTAVSVDAYTASIANAVNNWNMWGLLLALVPGARITIANLPQAQLGWTSRDAYVIGWALTYSATGGQFALTLISADDPAEIHIGDATYGRVTAGGDLLLSAPITAAALSMAVQFTVVGLSVDAGDYPLDLDLNGERITVTAAPGGSASPQTVAISARGVGGTVARAHIATEPVEMWLGPGVAW